MRADRYMVQRLGNWALFLVLAALSYSLVLNFYRRADYTPEMRFREGGFWAGRKEFTVRSPFDPMPGQIAGPLDSWGGGEGKAIHLIVPFCGPYTVAVGLLDSHDASPPAFQISQERSPPRTFHAPKGAGAYAQHWRAQGVRSTFETVFLSTPCADGYSSFTVRTIDGSWGAFEGIHVRPIIAVWKPILLGAGWILFIVSLCNHTYVSNPKRVPDTLVFIGSVILTIFYLFNYADRSAFPDTAFFGGDEYEYHTMGVNTAIGYGINKQAFYRPFEFYRFDANAEKRYPNLKKSLVEKGKRTDRILNILRTPGYPLFLGLIYSVHGVHPRIAKQVQFLFMMVIAGFLPYVGYRFLGLPGLVGGCSGRLFIP